MEWERRKNPTKQHVCVRVSLSEIIAFSNIYTHITYTAIHKAERDERSQSENDKTVPEDATFIFYVFMCYNNKFGLFH